MGSEGVEQEEGEPWKDEAEILGTCLWRRVSCHPLIDLGACLMIHRFHHGMVDTRAYDSIETRDLTNGGSGTISGLEVDRWTCAPKYGMWPCEFGISCDFGKPIERQGRDSKGSGYRNRPARWREETPRGRS